MPASDSSHIRRDFYSVASELTPLSAKELDDLAREAAQKHTSPGQLALQRGLLDASQIDIIETLLRPTEVVPGYEILAVLGHGGMGVVYRARQLNLKRLVALKTVLVNQLSDPTALERFTQEAEAVARLSHPHIVAAYDFGRHEGRLFFAMELVEGEDVQKLIRRRGELDEHTTWGIVRQAAAGLAHAAQQGVVHRDIKPGNLLLVEPPTGFALPAGLPMVKIADFGLAQLAASADERTRLTSPNVAIGSLHYMSPEQLCGETVDLRTDIFALGASAFHMLSGQPPQAGKLLSQIIAQRMNPQVESVHELRPDVSRASADLVAAMMHHDRNQRIADYGQLIQLIDALDPTSPSVDRPTAAYQVPSSAMTATAPFSVEPTSRVDKGRSVSRRKWFMLGAGALAVALILAAIAWRGEPVGMRDLARSGNFADLFSGQNINQWRPLSGGWGPAKNDEGAFVLQGRGLVRRSLAIVDEAGDAQPPEHYVLSCVVDLHQATAAELQFDLASDAADERYWFVSIDSQGATLGGRADAQGSPATVIVSRAHKSASQALHAIEVERQSHGWWVLVDGVLLGSVPFDHAAPAAEFRVFADGGQAWFSDVTVEQLAPLVVQ